MLCINVNGSFASPPPPPRPKKRKNPVCNIYVYVTHFSSLCLYAFSDIDNQHHKVYDLSSCGNFITVKLTKLSRSCTMQTHNKGAINDSGYQVCTSYDGSDQGGVARTVHQGKLNTLIANRTGI